MTDCILIGHNQIGFDNYADFLENTGNNCAVKDFRLNYFNYEGKRWHLAKIINTFKKNDGSSILLSLNDFYFSNTIAYLGSFLHKNNIKFDYIHSFQEEKEKLKDFLLYENVKYIVITTTYYIVAEPVKEIVEFIKKHNTKIKILVGGPFIANQIIYFKNTECLYNLFDEIGADIYVNSNQGEKTLVNIINLNNYSELGSISNIYYKDKNKYKYSSDEEECNKLEDNLIDWNLFKSNLKKCVNIRSSISCPYSCKFCGFHLRGGKFQKLEAFTLKKELDCLFSNKNVKYLNFIDDLFDIPIKTLKDILKMMINRNYNYKWLCMLRCSSLDEESVKLLKDAGCIMVFLGLESGSDKMLLNMNKKANVCQFSKGINLLKKYDVLVHGNFITGFPGENDQTVKETINFIRSCGIDFYRSQLWYYDHITPIHKDKDLYNLKGSSFEWEHSTMNSKSAMEIIYDIFKDINDPVWMPQNSLFNFDSLLQLYDFGFNEQNIKLIFVYLNKHSL